MNRKYDLDYLQWLQKNARLYWCSLGVVAFLMVLSIWMYYHPWQPQNNEALWQVRDSEQAVVEPENQKAESQNNETNKANKTEELAITKEGESHTTKIIQDKLAQSETEEEQPHRMAQNQMEQEETVPKKIEQEETEQKEAEQKETAQKSTEQTLDLLQLQSKLPTFTAPCEGARVYGYGFGYDPVYEDYRFHTAVCYQADGATAVAVSDGIVEQIDLADVWQITLRCGEYRLQYRGIQASTLTVGTDVSAGQPLGTAEAYLYVQATVAGSGEPDSR